MRGLLIGGFITGLILPLDTVLAIPGLETIPWVEQGSAALGECLLLLPVLNGLIWLSNLVAGTLLYRRGEDQPVAAYLLWGT